MRALIVDEGRERSSVAAARALRSTGWTVVAASPSPNIASRSKAVSDWQPVRHTSDGGDAFLESLEQAVRASASEVVFVTWEAAVAVVSARREELSCAVGYGPHEGVMTVMDKSRLSSTAGLCGVEVPRSGTLEEALDGRLGQRVVVKPALQSELSGAAQIFEDPGSAVAHARSIEAAGGRALLQEVADGRLVALTLVAGSEGIVSIAQQIAEHSWPQPAGVTARGLTVAVDPELRARVQQLLLHVGWQGLAQLQFIATDDGRHLLIDFNPRLYGSLALAVRAGANHPDAFARLATGRPVQPSEGRAGARYQWFSRDLRASLNEPRRASEVVRCITVGAGAAHSLWSWEEPLLAPRFLAAQAGRAVKRRVSER
ncbi:MAG TPA: ATP-grasp domain-containing protein [Solirubrobacteraceae bacterium]|jgi:predicted ATP-grasp superfamily ATP-dependent carboligase